MERPKSDSGVSVRKRAYGKVYQAGESIPVLGFPECFALRPKSSGALKSRGLFSRGSLPFFSTAENFYCYVGQLEARSALLAWGSVGGSGNTIGRDSKPLGNAVVRIGGRAVCSERNWVVADGLMPDTAYDYEIEIDGRIRGKGRLRTWEERSERFCFLVIGDYGDGSAGQYRVAEALTTEFERRADSDCPVRFVLTLGDNIYADANLGLGMLIRSGDYDSHWDKKFFAPYDKVLREVPFLPVLGNHDGNESENRADLFAYLDNFYFPGNEPARWYSFVYGGFARFVALDSTTNSEAGPPEPVYLEAGEQTEWLRRTLAESDEPWKIPYFHHPMYTAGPLHPGSFDALGHWTGMFEQAGVRVVFNGHEHNFQFSDVGRTGGVLYTLAGSGADLRAGDVRGSMEAERIAGWAAARIFLCVEIDGPTIRIMPMSPDPFRVVDAKGNEVALPLVQTLR
jgi:hypothetical protein